MATTILSYLAKLNNFIKKDHCIHIDLINKPYCSYDNITEMMSRLRVSIELRHFYLIRRMQMLEAIIGNYDVEYSIGIFRFFVFGTCYKASK